MAGYPPPYPPPPGQQPFGGDWKYQRRVLRDQARAQREIFRAQRDAYRAQYRGLRRGSIVGPILVIGIGIVFLLVQMNKLPSSLLWNWFGHWWPLLLIGVGIVVLIEWGFDQTFRRDTGQPYIRRSLGGGVVTLLVLMVVLGVIFQGMHGSGSDFFQHNFSFNQEDVDQFLGDKHESDQTLVQPFTAGSALEVDNPRGDVTISGTSDDNQIHVLLHREIYSRSDSDAASKAQQLTPSMETSGNLLQVKLPAINGARADLIITVPASSTNSITANHGDVHLSDVKGPVNITANHGDIELSAITGSITTHIQNTGSDFSAHSVTGPINLQGRGGSITLSDINGPVSIEGDFFGDTHVERVTSNFHFHTSRTDFQLARLDGAIDMSSDEDLSVDQAVGPLILTTRNRNITLDRIAGDVTIVNKNGKVDLTSAPPLGNISVENRNGEVSLTVPEQANFTVQADTTDADIVNDFSLPTSGTDKRKSLSGTVGKGGPTIKISTTQEDISVKRATVAPLPPLPPTSPALTAMPASARQAIREAQQAGKEAERQAKQAGEEATKEAAQAGRDAQRQARQAAEEARKAAKDANSN